MKIFNIIAVITATLFRLTALGQDTIYVSHNKETAVQFPAIIQSPLTSNSNLLAMIKKDNILTLKAARTSFHKTNFSVNTVDGRTYNFPVAFSYGRAGRVKTILPSVHNLINSRKLSSAEVAERLSRSARIHSVASDKNRSMKSQIGDISILGDNLFYKLKVKNRSSIGYDIDFIRFYVRDLKTAKRTVTQEQEIYPVDSYGTDLPSIEGKSAGLYVFTLKKFPIEKDKALFVEIYERNGARHLIMKVRQSDIEKARPFK